MSKELTSLIVGPNSLLKDLLAIINPSTHFINSLANFKRQRIIINLSLTTVPTSCNLSDFTPMHHNIIIRLSQYPRANKLGITNTGNIVYNFRHFLIVFICALPGLEPGPPPTTNGQRKPTRAAPCRANF